MTVYNRKMFRKGGMAKGTGILASGPEIIKAQQGKYVDAVSIPMSGVRNFSAAGLGSTQQNLGSPNPFSGAGGFIKDVFTKDSPSSMGQAINYALKGLTAKKITEEEDKAKEANLKAKDKIITPYTQSAITTATGAEPDVEAKEAPGFFSDTVANLKLFKENIKPSIEEFKKTYSDLPKVISEGAKEIWEGGTKELTAFLSKKMKKIATDDKARAEENAFLDAAGEKQGAVSKKDRELLYEEEKQSRILQGFLPGDLTPGEGEIIEIGGKKKLKTVDSSGNEVIKDLSEKEEKEISTAENLKKVGEASVDEKQLATTEEIGKGSKLNQMTATLDSNSEKSAKEGLNNTSILEKTFRDGLSLLGDDKTKSHIGDILGIKTFDNMTLGERTAAYKSILKETLGEDKDIKDDASFNLIMTGLLIASGDSPDALTNIARGLANGLKMYADNISDKRKEKKEIALAATKLAITADESAKERAFKSEENRLDRISKEFIASAKNQSSYDKLRADFVKKLVSNPEGYLGMRDKLIYAQLPEAEKPAYLNQLATDLANAFFNDKGQNVQVPYYKTLSGEEQKKAVKEMIELQNKAFEDGVTTFKYKDQTFDVGDKKLSFSSN